MALALASPNARRSRPGLTSRIGGVAPHPATDVSFPRLDRFRTRRNDEWVVEAPSTTKTIYSVHQRSAMPKASKRPLARRAQARAMRVVNVPMRVILALPFATPMSRRLMLIVITGRKTGKMYRQPVSYVRDGATLLTPGGGNWKRNLVDGSAVRIRLRGHDRLARPEIVRDRATIESLLDVMVAANPMLTRFVPIPRNSDGRLDQESLARAVEHGFAVIRWHVAPSQGSST
jgi:hypothetical protein